MSALQVFDYAGESVRTVLLDGEPFFVLADVCAVLDIANPSRVASSLSVDALRTTEVIDSMGRRQSVNAVDEGGLYEVIFQSRKPAARDFRRWVTRDVLPAIRQTGSYGTAPAPRELTRLELIDLARDSELRRIEAVQRAEVAETRALELEEPAAKYQQFMDADGTYGLNDVAKMIGGPGRTGLMQLMREDGILTRDNLPTQRHLIAGRFVVKVSRPWKMPDGTERVSRSTRVTAKGLDWLAQKYGPSSAQLLMLNGGGGEW